MSFDTLDRGSRMPDATLTMIMLLLLVLITSVLGMERNDLG
jgi:hypothetical protein